MLLKQVFKTHAGANKRAAFENTHSKTHNYYVEYCSPDGQTTYGRPWSDVHHMNLAECTYRLRKTKK